MRRYKTLAGDWQRRTFGRRTSIYFWVAFFLVLVLMLSWTPQGWRFAEGLVFGMVAMAFAMLPDTLMPEHIRRWQRGAWGEQKTARALKPLRKDGWVIRHDLATGYQNTNRDHIAAGPAVYLLDSKLLKDEVWLDEAGLHVRRVDVTREEYVVPAPTRSMETAARALKRDIEQTVGFPVQVYPVVVIWAHFGAGVQWDGAVVYIDGERVTEWLRSRPADLLDERKRCAVGDWLRTLPAN